MKKKMTFICFKSNNKPKNNKKKKEKKKMEVIKKLKQDFVQKKTAILWRGNESKTIF